MTETLRSYAFRMRLLRFLVLMLVLPAAAFAQTDAARKEPSAYDKIWGKFTEWYADDTNPVVQRVMLSGRFHYDFATIDADQGDRGESEHQEASHWPPHHLVPKVHVPWRDRARPTASRSFLRAVYRSVSDVDEKPSVRADGRQAEHALHGRRRELVTRTAHHRSE